MRAPRDHDQIEPFGALADQIAPEDLPEQSAEIAEALVSVAPDIAMRFAEAARDPSNAARDLRFAELWLSSAADDEGAMPRQEFLEKISDPHFRSLLRLTGELGRRLSAQALIQQAAEQENPVFSIILLSMWLSENAHNDDAILVSEDGMNRLVHLRASTPTSDMARDLCTPLLFTANYAKAENLLRLTDSILPTLTQNSATVPTLELRLLLAAAAHRLGHHEESASRLEDVLLEASDITDAATRAEVFATIFVFLNDNTEIPCPSGHRSYVSEEVERSITDLLHGTALHEHSLRGAVRTIARADLQSAATIAKRANTPGRRESLRMDALRAAFSRAPCTAALLAYGIQLAQEPESSDNRDRMMHHILTELAHRPALSSETLESCYATLMDFISKVGGASDRAWGYATLAELCAEKQLPSSSFQNCASLMKSSLHSIDDSTERISVTFCASAKMAKADRELAEELFSDANKMSKARGAEEVDLRSSFVSGAHLVIASYSGLLRRQRESARDLDSIEWMIGCIPAAHARAILWADVARAYVRADRAIPMRVGNLIMQNIGDIPEGDADVRAQAIRCAAPAIFKLAKGEELLRELGPVEQEEAWYEVARFLLAKTAVGEPCSMGEYAKLPASYEDLRSVIDVSDNLTSDTSRFALLKNVALCILRDTWHPEGMYTREQIQDVLRQLSERTDKFPTLGYLDHKGYAIALRGYIAAANRAKKETWEKLAAEAMGLPASDAAYTLALLLSVMKGHGATRVTIEENFEQSIADISMLEERIDRWKEAADMTYTRCPRFAGRCLRSALEASPRLGSERIQWRQQRILDIAYRHDASLAQSLASAMDDDPARRQPLVLHLKKLEDQREAVGGSTLRFDRLSAEQVAEQAWEGLSYLNAGQLTPRGLKELRPAMTAAGELPLHASYFLHAWVIKNAIIKYENTDQAGTILRPLFDSALSSIRLIYNISSRRRRASETIRTAHDMTYDNVLGPGQRHLAMQRIEDWLKDQPERSRIVLCDPYFSADDIDFFSWVLETRPHAEVIVLCGESLAPQSADVLRREWKARHPWEDPPFVTVAIVHTTRNGRKVFPIHDRVLLSECAGLRLGTSLNSLGVTRVSEVSTIGENDAHGWRQHLDAYLARQTKEHDGNRVYYSTITL